MKVFFRRLEDGSLVNLDHVFSLTVLSNGYRIVYQGNCVPLSELYLFRFFSLMSVSHSFVYVEG